MTTTSVRLLSAIRRSKSLNHLYTVPRDYFDEDEAEAFDFIRNFVDNYNRWPTAATVTRETGVTLVIPKEPVGYYLDEARKRSLYNALREPFSSITTAIREQRPDDVVQLMRDCVAMSSQMSGGTSSLVSYQDSVTLVEQDYDLAKSLEGLRGIATGYSVLDDKMQGLQNANMYTVVARPGRGKSQKLITISSRAHQDNRSVLFLSMEMGVLQLARRKFGLDAGIDPRYLSSGRLSTRIEREMRRQMEQMRDREGAPFYWLAGNFKKSVEALEAACHEIEPDLVVADAAYLMKPSDRTKANAKHELLSDVMESLGDLAIRLNRPVLISVQFNRMASNPRGGGGSGEGEQRQQRNPLAHLDLAKIAGSDAIGQVSAFVVGLDKVEPPRDRDERYAGILKSREGEDYGWYRYNYKFRPPNFSEIETYRSHEQGTNAHRPDLSYMDAEA